MSPQLSTTSRIKGAIRFLFDSNSVRDVLAQVPRLPSSSSPVHCNVHAVPACACRSLHGDIARPALLGR